MKTQGIPEHFHTITPYLIVKDAAVAIEFYKKAFGATEIMRMLMPNGKVAHAEMKIGNSIFMLTDEHPEMGATSPTTLNGTPITMHLYVPDVDAVAKKGIDAGLTVLRPVQNQFYGDRSGCFKDPFGHMWNIATRVENVSDEELNKRFTEMMKNGKSACQ